MRSTTWCSAAAAIHSSPSSRGRIYRTLDRSAFPAISSACPDTFNSVCGSIS